MRDPVLTLVVPCYNEATRPDTGAFLAWVSARPARYLRFVDDGSTDQTAAVLDRLSERHSRISVLHLSPNHGKAGAVRAGILQEPVSDVVGFWDADLATPLREVDRLIEVLLNNPDLQCVAGIRVMRLGARIERSLSRHVFSRLFVTVSSVLLGLHAYDTQCGAKLFQRNVVQPLFAESFVSPWFFDLELYVRLRALSPDMALTDRVCEQTLSEWKAMGHSSLRWRDFVKAPLELYQIYRRYR
jgi:glycosyltransferase involved in cell wall biosynthesis